MVWKFKNVDEFAKWCRQQERNSTGNALSQTVKKRAIWHEGQAYAFRFIAESIEGRSIIMDVEEVTVEARESLIRILNDPKSVDIETVEKILAVNAKLNACLNVKHFDRYIAKRKEANSGISSDSSGSAEPAQNPPQ